MKLGEAVFNRGKLEQSMDIIEKRIRANLIVQDGEQPNQDPKQLISTLESQRAEIKGLSRRIYDANDSLVTGDDGTVEPVSALLVRKRLLNKKIDLYKKFALAPRNNNWDSHKESEELKERRRDLQSYMEKKRAALQAELDKLDFAIQRANWEIDVQDV